MIQGASERHHPHLLPQVSASRKCQKSRPDSNLERGSTHITPWLNQRCHYNKSKQNSYETKDCSPPTGSLKLQSELKTGKNRMNLSNAGKLRNRSCNVFGTKTRAVPQVLQYLEDAPELLVPKNLSLARSP